MAYSHPHADATYRIVPQEDLTYGVEVSIPGTSPTLVTGLATERVAADWIEKHKQRVLAGPLRKGPWSQKTRAP